jgi:hypothetical protein
MRQSIIIACIAAFAAARDLRASGRKTEKQLQQEEDFSEWTSKSSKSYRSVEEFNNARQNYIDNDNFIENWNAEARGSGDPNAVILAHNRGSDLSEGDRARMKGHKTNHAPPTGRGVSQPRGLRAPKNLNWHEAGATGGPNGNVYDQGICGSCYSFAANRVLEGTIFA